MVDKLGAFSIILSEAVTESAFGYFGVFLDQRTWVGRQNTNCSLTNASVMSIIVEERPKVVDINTNQIIERQTTNNNLPCVTRSTVFIRIQFNTPNRYILSRYVYFTNIECAVGNVVSGLTLTVSSRQFTANLQKTLFQVLSN